MKNQRIRREESVFLVGFLWPLGSAFRDCSESRLCLACELLQLLENGDGEIGVLCMFVLVKKTSSWNKGFRFLTSACSDPPEISLPAASEFLCSGFSSASRGNRGSTAVSRTFRGLSKHPSLRTVPAWNRVLGAVFEA